MQQTIIQPMARHRVICGVQYSFLISDMDLHFGVAPSVAIPPGSKEAAVARRRRAYFLSAGGETGCVLPAEAAGAVVGGAPP